MGAPHPPSPHAKGPAAPPFAGQIASELDAYLSEWLDGLDLPDSLLGAMRYAALQGGKRLRPMLAWLSAAAVGPAEGAEERGRRSLPAGAAIELIHAFSLVHDDLPALDDDDLRRGRPTLHVHAGEAMAILAGDAMLTLAFGALAAASPAGTPYSDGLKCALQGEIVRATTAMIVGQIDDTLGASAETADPAARLERIHRNKTGALIRAACRCGALIGLEGQPGAEDRLDAITTYAESVGLMFQIVDDLIDVEQPAHHAGKRTGKDAEAGKLTYPQIHGVAASRAEISRLSEVARGAVDRLGPAATPLGELAGYMAGRTS